MGTHIRKTIVFGMPSKDSFTRGYCVPNLGGVFGMGVQTPAAGNDPLLPVALYRSGRTQISLNVHNRTQ
jgi:hypothetical protein